MDRDELIRLNDLATSKEWSEIRRMLLDKVIYYAKGSTSPEKIQGMLVIIDEPNNWITSFNAELKKVHKERKY